MHHDKNFKRTSNIGEVFPDRVDVPAAMFNISDIEKLNVGPWFMKVTLLADFIILLVFVFEYFLSNCVNIQILIHK